VKLRGWVTVQNLSKIHADELIMVAQEFCKEVIIWKTLQHPNVVPLLGATMNNAHFAMVSDWMINGTINEFIKAHGDANRFELVGFDPRF